MTVRIGNIIILKIRQVFSALTLRHCLHACAFSFRSQRDNTFYELETFSGNPGLRFSLHGIGNSSIKKNQPEFRTLPGSKTYKRFLRRRESIDIIIPDSSFHQHLILS